MERSGPTPSAPRRARLPGGSGTGGAPTAAAESHRCWSAAGTYVRAGLYLCTFGRRTCADSTTPSYLAVSGWLAGGVRGKRDLRGCFYHPPWQLLGWRLGWKDCCCGWLLLDLLEISRMLCSVAVSGVMLPTVPDPHRKNKKQRQAWKEVARHPPLPAGPACPAGAAPEEHLLLLRKATAAGLLLEHMYVLVCICAHLVAERAPTRRLPPTHISFIDFQ